MGAWGQILVCRNCHVQYWVALMVDCKCNSSISDLHSTCLMMHSATCSIRDSTLSSSGFPQFSLAPSDSIMISIELQCGILVSINQQAVTNMVA
jgi:hypothetical protein